MVLLAQERTHIAALATLLVPRDGSWRNCPGVFPYLGSIKAYSSQHFLLQGSKRQELGVGWSFTFFVTSKAANFSSPTWYSFNLPLIYTGHPQDTGSTPGMFPTARPAATAAFLLMPQMPQILHLLQSSGSLGMALSGTPRWVQQWTADVCAEVKSGQHSPFSRGGCYQFLKVLYPSS